VVVVVVVVVGTGGSTQRSDGAPNHATSSQIKSRQQSEVLEHRARVSAQVVSLLLDNRSPVAEIGVAPPPRMREKNIIDVINM
jgi:hypothetical protein